MTQRIVSISGLRGIVGDGLDPAYVAEFAMGVGTLAGGGTVVLSRDGRATGEMVRHAVVAGLMATGCQVLDIGIATTPTCGVMVQHFQAAGGLQITASHNPVEWNGLKPFSSAGSVLNQDEGAELMSILEKQSFRTVGWDRLGRVTNESTATSVHLEKVLKLIDVNAIRDRRFKVVLDCNHGSGAMLGPKFLESLGCEVHVLGGVADGRFAHTPEPVAENLTGLCEAVREQGADAGFAQDPDADRLAIVDENGRYIGEELTAALCADYLLAERPGAFVVNASTSRVSADVAARHDCAFHRSFVGEANVVARMREVEAVLGGEGNGGVIEPRVGFVRDSLVAMGYVLAGLNRNQQPLSAWADSLPHYAIVKDKLTCPRERVADACSALRSTWPDAEGQEGDGLRLDWPDRWVQVRASNTEPILRVIAEAPGEEEATKLCREAMEIVKGAVGG